MTQKAGNGGIHVVSQLLELIHGKMHFLRVVIDLAHQFPDHHSREEEAFAAQALAGALVEKRLLNDHRIHRLTLV